MGEKTLVFLINIDGTGKSQQTPELNNDLPGQPLDFCVQHLALNVFSLLAVQTGERLFFSTCEVYTHFFFFFFLNNVIECQLLRSTLFDLVMKCTNVLLKGEIKSHVSECLMRILSRSHSILFI